MAIQNVFANLADPKTMQDFQNEMIAQQMAKQQLANAQIQNKASTLSLDEATRKADISNRINQAGRQAITLDAEGNPLVNQKKLTGLITEIDPLTGIEYGAKQAKSQADLLKGQSEAKSQELKNALDKVKLTNDFTSNAVQSLQSINPNDNNSFLMAKQQAINSAVSLGLNDIAESINQGWQSPQQIPQLLQQGLKTQDYLSNTQKQLEFKYKQNQDVIDNTFKTQEFGFKVNKEGRDQAEFNRIQSGILTPQDEQKAVKTIQDQIQTVKNANKIDEAEQGFAQLSSLYGKDKNGNIKFRGLNDKTGASFLSLILAYNRAINPGNQVTVTEGKITGDTTGWDERVQNIYNQFQSGKNLSENQVKEIYDITKKSIDAKRKALDTAIKPFINQSQSLALPLDQIFTENEIKRNKIGLSNNQDRRNNPLGGLPNAPQNPFSRNADVPPPAYTGIVDRSGNVQTLGSKQQMLVPNLSNKKFTELPMQDRQLIQQRAKQKGVSPQDYYNGLQGFIQ